MPSAPLGPRTVGQTQWTPAPDPPSSAGSPSLGWLVGSLVQDFKRLPSGDAAALLAIGATGALFSASADQPSSRLLSRSNTLDEVLDPGATIGGARMQMIGALATYGLGRVTRSPKVAAIGGDLIKAQVLTQAVTAGIKLSVGRTRPDGTQYSFPSGHTSVTFASATVLQRHLGLKVGIPAYAVATYVAASRIQERRHYLSDVAFGAALGIIGGRTVTIGRGQTRFGVTPVAVPGGGGVSVDWLGKR